MMTITSRGVCGLFLLFGAVGVTASVKAVYLNTVGCAAADEDKPAEPADNTPVKVLVAKKKIPAMTWIKKTADYFELQEKPRSEVRKDALSDVDDKDLKEGFRVARGFEKGAVLRLDDLMPKNREGGCNNEIPPGTRAMAIKVGKPAGGGDIARPGSKVDVLCTLPDPNGKIVTRKILGDILLLCVDQGCMIPNPDAPQHDPTVTIVVLAIKPKDAEMLVSASESGLITLSPRPLAKDTKRDTKSDDTKQPTDKPKQPEK